MKTEEIIKALRACVGIDGSGCASCCRKDIDEEALPCFDALKMDASDRLDELQERCIRYAEEAMELKARMARYEEAERDGRLLVLPCGVDVDLNKNGHTFKANHWNHFLTAFRDAPETKSGKQVELFSIEEAEAALDMAISALRAQQDHFREATKMVEPLENGVSDKDVGKWIRVKDRLPDRTMPPHDVLVYHNLNCGMFIDRAWYSHEKNKWRSAVGMNLKVTHWMPLPEPPEEGTP